MQLDIVDWLTSSSAGGHARETPSPESALALPTTGAISGGNSSESSSKRAHATSSRKTSAASFPSTVAETLASSSTRWPTQGSMRGGSLTARPTSVRPTGESDSGCSRGGATWPTPRATDGEKGGPGQVNGRGVADSLPGVVGKAWPTPTLDDVNNATRDSGSFQSLTRAAVNQPWASPRAADANGVGPVGSESWNHKLKRGQLDAQSMESTSTGRLNAAWVAQIMGWPDGWITGLPAEVFGRLEEEKRSTRGKRRASSKSAPKATSKP